MARKAKVYNWEAVKELYIQGVRYRAISDQLGVPIPTLKARIIKERWVDAKMAVMEQRAPKPEPEGETREAVSKRFRRWFADDAEKVMKALELHDPTGLELRELEQRESVVKSLYTRVSAQFGWESESEGHQAIRGNLLAQLAQEVVQQREIVEERKAKSKVIDVQPVATTEQDTCQEATTDNSCCASTSDCEGGEGKHAFSEGEPADEGGAAPL